MGRPLRPLGLVLIYVLTDQTLKTPLWYVIQLTYFFESQLIDVLHVLSDNALYLVGYLDVQHLPGLVVGVQVGKVEQLHHVFWGTFGALGVWSPSAFVHFANQVSIGRVHAKPHLEFLAGAVCIDMGSGHGQGHILLSRYLVWLLTLGLNISNTGRNGGNFMK